MPLRWKIERFLCLGSEQLSFLFSVLLLWFILFAEGPIDVNDALPLVFALLLLKQSHKF